MSLWRKDRDGNNERFIPSEYVFKDMDHDDACAILGRLLDLLWETGKLSDPDIVEIIGFDGIASYPFSKVNTETTK